MITLLRADGAEYPTDYLLARLRGRKAERRLRTPQPEKERDTREYAREVRWLYRQMNRKSKRKLAPLFVLFELQEFIHWLRRARGAAESEGISARFLDSSLWPPVVLRAWSRRETAQERLTILEHHLISRIPECQGVSTLYAADNPAAVERRLLGPVLTHGATAGPSPLLREYFRGRLDCANLMAVAKSWLWRLPAPPLPIPGGQLAPEQLDRIWRTGDGHRLGLPAGVSKETITPAQIAALAAKKKGALRQAVHNECSSQDPVAVIMDYLCFLEEEAVQG